MALLRILYNRLRVNLFISLIIAILAGRIMYGIVVYCLAIFFGIKMQTPIIAVVTAIKTGIVGIIIQIVIIPIIVKLLEGEFTNVRSNTGPKKII